jgi:alanyl-tRNA synthetase
VSGLQRQLTVAPQEIGAAIERFQAEARANQKTLRELRETLAANDAGPLAGAAEDFGAFRRVVVTREGWDLAALKTLATAIAAHPGCVAVIIGGDSPVPVVAARARDVKDETFDASAWIRQITAALGGRGGGRPELAQGGVAASVDHVLAFAQKSVR